jgi:hypothetical protein
VGLLLAIGILAKRRLGAGGEEDNA